MTAPLAVGAVLLPLMLLAIVPAAMLSFRLVEAPGMALGRLMARSLFPDRHPRATLERAA